MINKNCCEVYLEIHEKWKKIVELIEPNKKQTKDIRHHDYSNAAILWQDVKQNAQYVNKVYEMNIDDERLKILLNKLDELYELNKTIMDKELI